MAYFAKRIQSFYIGYNLFLLLSKRIFDGGKSSIQINNLIAFEKNVTAHMAVNYRGYI